MPLYAASNALRTLKAQANGIRNNWHRLVYMKISQSEYDRKMNDFNCTLIGQYCEGIIARNPEFFGTYDNNLNSNRQCIKSKGG